MPLLSEGENPYGFHRKYAVSKADGSPVDPNAEYLVLRLDDGCKQSPHFRASRKAAHTYANEIEEAMPEVAEDIRAWYPEPD